MRRKSKKATMFLLTASILSSSIVNYAAAEEIFFNPETSFIESTSEPESALEPETEFSANIPDEQAGEIFFSDEDTENLFGDSEGNDYEVFSDSVQEEEGSLAGELAGDGLPSEPLLSASGISDNVNRQNYSRWSSPVQSYLTAEDSGYLRVEYVGEQVLIERYNTELLLTSQKFLSCELPYFGGFYAGTDAYYLVFGQSNKEENDSKEVIRVVKYNKNWNRLGASSLYGANTTYPFDAGSVRMAEYGGYLYIRTSHEMYTSSDGYNHQANLTIQVRTSDMSLVDAYYIVMNISEGYVSHSFNQFIIVDDQANIVAVDHGDAYPRSVVIGSYNIPAGNSYFSAGYSWDDVLSFQGAIGENSTGASIGALEYSSSSYLTAGNSVVQDGSWGSRSVRNIFVGSTPKGRIANGASTVQWITGYQEGGGISASTPQMAKLGPDSFLLLWNQMQDYSPNGKLSYIFLDGRGNPVSPVYTKDGYISDCKPIVLNGTAVWYTTDGKKLTFYRVKPDGTYETEPVHIHAYEPEMHFEKSEVTCGLIQGTVLNPLSTNTDGSITYTSSDPSIAEADSNGVISLKALGSCTITANASAGINYAAKSLSYTLTILPLKKQTIKTASNVSCSYGDADFSLKASCEGNARLSYSSNHKEIVTVSDQGIVSVKGTGNAVITIIAHATSEYAGDMVNVNVTVNKKQIGQCQLVFTKIGSIPSDPSTFNKYIAISDGDNILKESVDYELWGGSWWYSGNSLMSVTKYVEGIGNYTGEADLTVKPIRAKTVLSSAAMTSKGVNLSWEKEEGAIGYCIYKKQANGKFKLVKKITNRNTTKWTDTSAKKESSVLSYYIKAYTKNGSSVKYAKKSAVKYVIPAPKLKSVKPSGSGKLKITWNKVNGADGYIVLQKSGNSWKKLATTKSAAYVHTGVRKGTTNTYTIQAYKIVNNKTINGAYSKTGIKGKAK